MKYRAILIFCLLLAPAHSVTAGEWRYNNPVTPSTSAMSMEQPSAQPVGSHMPSSMSAPISSNIPVPVNNMSMKVVQTEFGSPDNVGFPVGDPPIARWYYPRYTVYFEFDRVIISVIN